MDNRDFDHHPGFDTMAKQDGGLKQDFKNGMLARLARFDNSRAGKIVIAICWVGMIGVAIAAVNLFLDRPWF